MPAKLYKVTLTDVERQELSALVRKGKGVAVAGRLVVLG
jgi:hypothetical protein